MQWLGNGAARRHRRIDLCARSVDEILRDDEGRIVEAGRVYWYPDYAVRDEIEEIRTNMELVFQGVE